MLALLLLLFFCFSYSTEVVGGEYGEDLSLLTEIEERLEELRKRAGEEGATADVVDELNSYGYTLHTLRSKYARRESMLRRVSQAYEKLLYIKRSLLPELLIKEVRRLGLPVCEIEAKGEERRVLVLRLKDPKDREVVRNLLTNTQLQFAHLIGVETVRFERCD